MDTLPNAKQKMAISVETKNNFIENVKEAVVGIKNRQSGRKSVSKFLNQSDLDQFFPITVMNSYTSKNVKIVQNDSPQAACIVLNPVFII